MSAAKATADTDSAAYAAIELIYHSYLTGLILMLASRAGPARAAEVVFRTFRRQQLARFLSGLQKLGLSELPHAVACAQYHYLSNQVGGVKVEYIYENDGEGTDEVRSLVSFGLGSYVENLRLMKAEGIENIFARGRRQGQRDFPAPVAQADGAIGDRLA